MSYNALMAPKFKWFDSNGDPAADWTVYAYAAGTPTAKTTYSTATGTDNDWPVVLDANGEADIYLDGSYKIVLKDADGDTSWTLDDYEGIAVEAVVTSVVATLAAIGTGTTDGEMVIDAGTGNKYTWDDGNSKWRICSGNLYATASLPTTTTYTIETGTTVYDTTTGQQKYYSGTAWVLFDIYDYVMIPASAFEPCTTNGCGTGLYEYGTNDIDRFYLAFDGGATEERAQVSFIMPEDWDRSTVKAIIQWTGATGCTAADTVEFGVKLGAFSNDDALDATLGTAQVISDALIANNGTDLQTTSATPAITVGGTPALKDEIVLELYRNTDGTDNMSEDAWVFRVWIQYKKSNAIAAW